MPATHTLKDLAFLLLTLCLSEKGTEYAGENIADKLGLPLFIKPNAGGSSFGISKVKTVEEIEPAILKAFEESNEVIIESFISGHEFTCGLYKTPEKECVFPITEVIPANEFFDFEAKYNAEKAQEITPARLPQETTERIQKITSLIYDILGCKGIARVDYMLSDNKNIFTGSEYHSRYDSNKFYTPANQCCWFRYKRSIYRYYRRLN